MELKKKYRIGIDVGGTFTHAAAIDCETGKLAGKSKVPTTHHSEWGVGKGVVESLSLVMSEVGIQGSQIALVAHSTTQATNSLLEGDVDPVAIVSIGKGGRGRIAARAARLGNIPLSEGKFLRTTSFHFSPGNPSSVDELDEFLKQSRQTGIRVVVVTAPFSVEDASQEQSVAEYIRTQGFLVTATHEVSQLYGFKVRTRTTAINASILPKMMEVATHTEAQIRKAGITAPFLIMRSDGGVMTLDEMKKKPILTLLSGPAAGIAAALRYLKISDGIFLEVGGTSTDISVIKNGRAITRTAVIGGNKTFLRTLDCRTLGVGGGSVPRVSLNAAGKISNVKGVGPRSAHIAQLKYAAFDSESLKPFKVTLFAPCNGDPDDYLKIESNPSVTWTPTCAANFLGFVPDGDPALAFKAFSQTWNHPDHESEFGISARELSQQILEQTTQSVAQTIRQLIREYRLDATWTTLIGGGGGASAIVPHLAKSLGMRFEIAQDADVISAIGVAMGMLREVVEKSIVAPTAEDLFKIRMEARNSVLSQGASPQSIETLIEVDSKRSLVTCEAQGSIEFEQNQIDVTNSKQNLIQAEALNDGALLEQAKSAFSLQSESRLKNVLRTRTLTALTLTTPRIKWFSKFRRESLQTYALVQDTRGVVRLRLKDAEIFETTSEKLPTTLRKALNDGAIYGDGGIEYPRVFAIIGDRLMDFSKLHTPEHLHSVVSLELKDIPAQEPAILITSVGAMDYL